MYVKHIYVYETVVRGKITSQITDMNKSKASLGPCVVKLITIVETVEVI